MYRTKWEIYCDILKHCMKEKSYSLVYYKTCTSHVVFVKYLQDLINRGMIDVRYVPSSSKFKRLKTAEKGEILLWKINDMLTFWEHSYIV